MAHGDLRDGLMVCLFLGLPFYHIKCLFQSNSACLTSSQTIMPLLPSLGNLWKSAAKMVILEPNSNQSTAHRPTKKKCLLQIRLFIDFSTKSMRSKLFKTSRITLLWNRPKPPPVFFFFSLARMVRWQHDEFLRSRSDEVVFILPGSSFKPPGSYEKSVLQGFQYLPEKICHKPYN